MTDTTCHMSISLDGFVAGPDQARDNPLGTRGRELHGDEQESAATSSSLESTDGANDDLEPRGEQGGPNDAA